MPNIQTRGSLPRLLTLIVAGEVAFLLPFVLLRVIRPALLEWTGLTQFQLGQAFSAYGIVAMLAYLLGGPLADRWPPRYLMSAALAATAIGALAWWWAPSPGLLIGVYAYWGCTTILLFWAPLLRATREWGGPSFQGRAFGGLEAGRGLVAAALATLLASGFAYWLPAAGPAQDSAALGSAVRAAIILSMLITLFAAVLVWWQLPSQQLTDQRPRQIPWGLWKQPVLWWQAAIIFCAYMGYKSTDYWSQYARDVLHVSHAQAAHIAAASFWLRPAAALVCGWLADRWSADRICSLAFSCMAVGAAALACLPSGFMWAAALLLLGVTALGIYGLRGVYFSLTGQAGLPLAVTGAAVGWVSFWGFTPDVIAGPLYGAILDAYPQAAGHRVINGGLAMLGVLGVFFVWRWRRAQPTLATTAMRP